MGKNLNRNTIITESPTALPFTTFGSGNFKVFPVSGTFITPTGIPVMRVRVWGAGGSGGVARWTNGNCYNATGGAGGGYAEKIIIKPSGSYTVTVGAGGASNSGTVDATNGSAGGTSSFGSVCSATGGGAGTAVTGANLAATPTGGTGTGGDFNYTGGSGGSLSAAANLGYYGATGGGSAAGFWGNGYAGGAHPVNTGSGNGLATGGGGIGGSGGTYFTNNQATSTYLATGGGSSVGPGSNIVGYPSAASRGGPDLFGNFTTTVAGTAGSGTDGTTFSSTGTTIYSFGYFFQKYVGEWCYGSGGGAAYGPLTAGQRGGNGGPGGGGGATLNHNGTVTLCLGGAGGAFGGGGGHLSLNSGGTGGAGGIGAGGGASGTGAGTATGGAGGAGLIVVEW